MLCALVAACALGPAVVPAMLATSAVSAASAASAEEAPASPAEVAMVVRGLEVAIAQARERLLLLVSTPRAKGAMPLHEEPELKQIARELPGLERELERWARLETRPASKTGE